MVAHPYHGAFSDELNFKGLADYSDVYAGELKKVENKKEEIVNIESRIYGNVLALFAIFAAIFTLVNVNAGGLSSNITTVNFVALDLLIIGGFLVLASAIEAFLVKNRERRHRCLSYWALLHCRGSGSCISVSRVAQVLRDLT